MEASAEMSNLDAVDLAILDQLQEDGRASYRDIGQQVGVTHATVRTRVQQLISSGVVRIMGVPNTQKLGFGSYLVALTLDPAETENVVEALVARDETSWLGINATGCDVMCEFVFRTIQEFDAYRRDVLAKLPGYRDAKIFVVSDVRKLHYRLHVRDDSAVTRSAAAPGTTVGS
jgi:Lrp/AsnC family transcriptional regulator, regulator for asnA, asnC and gidA